MEAGYNADAFRRQARCLLRRRTIPQSNRARKAPANGDFERHRGVHQDGSRLKTVANRFQDFHLGPKRDRKQYDLRPGGSVGIGVASDLAGASRLRDSPGSLLSLLERARTDAHARPCFGETQRQTASFSSRAPNYRNDPGVAGGVLCCLAHSS